MAVTYSESISTSEFSAAHLADSNIPSISIVVTHFTVNDDLVVIAG